MGPLTPFQWVCKVTATLIVLLRHVTCLCHSVNSGTDDTKGMLAKTASASAQIRVGAIIFFTAMYLQEKKPVSHKNDETEKISDYLDPKVHVFFIVCVHTQKEFITYSCIPNYEVVSCLGKSTCVVCCKLSCLFHKRLVDRLVIWETFSWVNEVKLISSKTADRICC